MLAGKCQDAKTACRHDIMPRGLLMPVMFWQDAEMMRAEFEVSRDVWGGSTTGCGVGVS